MNKKTVIILVLCALIALAVWLWLGPMKASPAEKAEPAAAQPAPSASTPAQTPPEQTPEQTTEAKFQAAGYGGMWIDYCGSAAPKETGQLNRADWAGEENVVIGGWAADFDAMRPLSAMYVHVGEERLPCQYGIKREAVAEYFGTQDLLNTGFDVAVPAAALENTAEISFELIAADGTASFAPVIYKIY